MEIIDRPAIEFVDVEKVLLSVAPKDEDGRLVVLDFNLEWSVEDQVPVPPETGDVVVLLEGDTAYERWAVSGVPGTCVVVVSNGNLVERMPVTIKYGEPSALNLSAGTPVHE